MSRVFKNKKDIEKQSFINEIKRAELDVKTAESFFQVVTDPELVDVAIYELEAKKSRYTYLIKKAKEKGVRAYNVGCLKEAKMK